MSDIKLVPSWKSRLEAEFHQEYMIKLKAFLKSQYDQKKVIYPKGSEYFAALNLTPFEKVKVVIVGQDPYHGPDQAHGLAFSVRKGIRKPPSLVNIFKELESDLGIKPSHDGYLAPWAEHGVLLLNSVLTVEEGKPGSHQGKGWEIFTDRIIQLLNDEQDAIAFILWGSYAQKKGKHIDRKKHFVHEGVHPSPLSSHRGFFGSRPFSKVNKFLESKGKKPVDWSLPS